MILMIFSHWLKYFWLKSFHHLLIYALPVIFEFKLNRLSYLILSARFATTTNPHKLIDFPEQLLEETLVLVLRLDDFHLQIFLDVFTGFNQLLDEHPWVDIGVELKALERGLIVLIEIQWDDGPFMGLDPVCSYRPHW